MLGEVKVSIKKIVSLLYISVAIKASILTFSMLSVHKNTISNMFLEFSNFKIVDLILIAILIVFSVASSGCGKGVHPKLFLFHRALGEVNVLIQNFLFHRVLGEVKIQASVSSRMGGRSMFYKHLLYYIKNYLNPFISRSLLCPAIHAEAVFISNI